MISGGYGAVPLLDHSDELLRKLEKFGISMSMRKVLPYPCVVTVWIRRRKQVVWEEAVARIFPAVNVAQNRLVTEF